MSAISDKARDFWDRISPRERRLVVIAAVVAPITVAIWLGSAIHDGLDAMEARNDRTRRALTIVEDMKARGDTHQDDADRLIALMGTEPLSLPTYLDTAAKKAKFELKAVVTPHAPQTRGDFVTNSVSLTLDHMDIEEVKDFLQQIETDSKFVATTRLELRRNFRDHDKLDLTLEVSTYSKVPKQPEGNGSGSGSDNGGSGSDDQKGG